MYIVIICLYKLSEYNDIVYVLIDDIYSHKSIIYVKLNIPSCYNRELMTWYSQPTQDINSAVLQRIVSMTCPILLFTRLPGEPYVYLGSLIYTHHDDRKKPIQFSFKVYCYLLYVIAFYTIIVYIPN